MKNGKPLFHHVLQRVSYWKKGTFSPWPLSLVDRADSLLLNVGE
jgi:hypothetical protein